MYIKDLLIRFRLDFSKLLVKGMTEPCSVMSCRYAGVQAKVREFEKYWLIHANQCLQFFALLEAL